MADTMIFDEAGTDLRRAIAERDALAKRVEELTEIVCEAVDWMPPGCDCDIGEDGSCTMCRARAVIEATRRAGREKT